MKIVICETRNELGSKVAKEITQLIESKPDCVLGLPTGETPLTVYKELVNLFDNGIVDFSKVTTFNLDEYLGIANYHPCSYNKYMNDNLFDKINIPKTQINIPDGSADSPEEECSLYESLIQKHGGMDLIIVGIGHNGHIGFNEPGTSFTTRTHIVELSSDTIDANSRFFEKKEDVPKKAITMGISTIMSAKRVILIASGESKSKIVFDAFNSDVSEAIPASILQRHNDVTVVLDRQAADLYIK